MSKPQACNNGAGDSREKNVNDSNSRRCSARKKLKFDVPNHKPATTAQATPEKRTSTIQIHVVAPQGKLKEGKLKNMKFGFMSSVCPSLTLTELIDKAKHYNYEHLELRVEWDHGHGVELDSTPQQLREARHRLADSGIELSCIATGVRFIDPDAQKRAEQVDLLKRYIDLSETVGAKNIRIFGDRVPDTPVEVSQTLDWEAEGIRACDGLAGDAGVALCLETHGNLIASWVAETLHRAAAQNTFVNWHAAHHVRHGEPIDVAYVHLRGKVRHAHVNFGDSGPLPDTEKDSLTLLAQDGYDGFVSIEVINPPDSEAVLQRHIELYNAL